MMRRVQTLMLALAMTTVVGAGCGRHLYGREDLTVDLAKHHIDLRWGRLENAAMRVNPELRGPFVQAWSLRLAELELQDMDVIGVAMIDDDTAEVVVAVTYVDKATMGVRTIQLPERWVRTDDGWRLASVAPLPQAPQDQYGSEGGAGPEG
jgi:hypothetical protein